MNYYESVVIDYLRADRAIFVNTEYCLQLNRGTNPDTSGPHWYCDAVALDFRSQQICLCEISYAAKLGALMKRLKDWHQNWEKVCQAIWRDSCLGYRLSEPWLVRPWLFVPKKCVPILQAQLNKLTNGQPKFDAKITHLEQVQPWCYKNFNLNNEIAPSGIENKTPIVFPENNPGSA